jgi:hypothetical protein
MTVDRQPGTGCTRIDEVRKVCDGGAHGNRVALSSSPHHQDTEIATTTATTTASTVSASGQRRRRISDDCAGGITGLHVTTRYLG